jgi:hypothetical protein
MEQCQIPFSLKSYFNGLQLNIGSYAKITNIYVSKGQGHTKVIMVHDTPPYGHAPTYQISLIYLKTKMLWPREENTI